MHSPVYQTNTSVNTFTHKRWTSLIYYKQLNSLLLYTIKNPDVLTLTMITQLLFIFDTMHSPVYQTNTSVNTFTHKRWTSLIYYKPLNSLLLYTIENPDVLTLTIASCEHSWAHTQIDSKLQRNISIMCKSLGNYKSQWHPLKMSGMYPTLALI